MLMFNKQELHHVDCESIPQLKGPRNKEWIARP